MKMPERSHTFRVPLPVKIICPKVLFLYVKPFDRESPDRHTHGSDSITSTADAGGKEALTLYNYQNMDVHLLSAPINICLLLGILPL